MSTVFMRFKKYCEDNHILLLGDDIKFICIKLTRAPQELHRAILRDYYKEWREGMVELGSPHGEQNRGRKRANSYLREKIGAI